MTDNNWLHEFIETVENSPELTKEEETFAATPTKWRWLEEIHGLPALVAAALKEYGTNEYSGSVNNKKIINWAKEVADCKPTSYNNWAGDWYNRDSIPWCGLFMAVMACRTMGGKPDRAPAKSYLTALAWASWGEPVDRRNINNIWCGDVVTFTREGGGHVAIVIGVSTDGKNLICIGGNQSNAVNIKLFPMTRVYNIRRPRYRVRPLGAKHLRISPSGVPTSINEG